MRLLDYFLRGGFLMWPLLACSIAALALAVERAIILYREPTEADRLLDDFAAAQHPDELREAARARGWLVGSLVDAAIRHRDEPPERLAALLDSLGNELVGHLEAPLGALRAIAEIAPLLGFLGTVTGLIGAFDAIVQQGSTTPHVVAAGVSTALITTAGGLAVGIPAFLACSLLGSRLDRVAAAAERVAEHVAARLGAEPAP